MHVRYSVLVHRKCLDNVSCYLINKNKYFEAQKGPEVIRTMENAIEMSSILEFLGFYLTPARVALENAAVGKEEKKKKEKRTQILSAYVQTENMKAKENSSLK